MPLSDSALAAAVEKFAEFERIASQLDMPRSERLNILNMSNETYTLLRSGRNLRDEAIQPEAVRRLSYALPLMRRLGRDHAVGGVVPSMGDMQLQAA